jgi:hypothetical protein
MGKYSACSRGIIVGLACFCVISIRSWPALAQSHVRQSEEDSLRAIERRRLRALIGADTATGFHLHAPDFQLITPGGASMNREQDLGGLASGLLRYATWEPDTITVRLFDSVAVLRYRSRLVMVVSGRDTVKPFAHWHTDVYEKRDGRWQAVWSQATPIRTPARGPLLESARAGRADSVMARYVEMKRGRESAVWAFDESQLTPAVDWLLQNGRKADAIRVLEYNVAEYPNAVAPHLNLAEGYLAGGDTARAVEAYNRALYLDPRNTTAMEAVRRLRPGRP